MALIELDFKLRKQIERFFSTMEHRNTLIAQQNDLLAAIADELRTARIERSRKTR